MVVNIGKNILESMKVKGITQTELAKLLGVKQNTVSQWINGVNEPKCQTIVNVLRAGNNPQRNFRMERLKMVV